MADRLVTPDPTALFEFIGRVDFDCAPTRTSVSALPAFVEYVTRSDSTAFVEYAIRSASARSLKYVKRVCSTALFAYVYTNK